MENGCGPPISLPPRRSGRREFEEAVASKPGTAVSPAVFEPKGKRRSLSPGAASELLRLCMSASSRLASSRFFPAHPSLLPLDITAFAWWRNPPST